MKFYRSLSIVTALIVNVNVYSQRSENYIKVDTIKFENELMVMKKICIDSTETYCHTLIDYYYLNGVKKISIVWDWENRINGYVPKYYPNGIIEEETFYVKGRRVGLYTTYFDNGKIKSVGRYKDINCYADVHLSLDMLYEQGESGNEVHQIFNVNEEKVGKWLYFDKEGVLIKTEEYLQ